VTVAIAATLISRERVGRKHETVSRLVLSSTYVTGGVPVTPSTFGLTTIDTLTAQPSGATTTTLGTQWDPAASKIMLTETAGTVDLPFKELSSGATVAQSLDVTARGLG
jgi:hypothetical protein